MEAKAYLQDAFDAVFPGLKRYRIVTDADGTRHAEAAQLVAWPDRDTPTMFGRVLRHLSQAMQAAQTLIEAYDYYLARCLEAGIGPEDAAAAWDIHSSEAFEAELVEAES
jgi:hypothetical protein